MSRRYPATGQLPQRPAEQLFQLAVVFKLLSLGTDGAGYIGEVAGEVQVADGAVSAGVQHLLTLKTGAEAFCRGKTGGLQLLVGHAPELRLHCLKRLLEGVAGAFALKQNGFAPRNGEVPIAQRRQHFSEHGYQLLFGGLGRNPGAEDLIGGIPIHFL
ncbi:hypothetical protein PK28_04520 [Hymenobacter sp. DG25B]|uniref:hypothetical protein n=1 Tax=Hymenobacter sp. DG25B TaxID=1385664 RepID=UPI000540C7E8|nr:hypothetical protein [Hymenobacter sp. DG25B]AIZ63135.1 hypothetical protein PK28_04520 [Hymenobacter sp. DG25B]